jgi:hypothetical protein
VATRRSINFGDMWTRIGQVVPTAEGRRRDMYFWKSKRQSVVTLSSAEAEFISASSMVQEMIYVRRLLETLGFPQSVPTPIYEDSRTCIACSEELSLEATRLNILI